MGLYLVGNYALNRLELVIYWWLSLGPEPKPEFKGDERTFRLWLDTNQYQQDMAETVHGSEASWILTNCVVPPKLISQKLRFAKNKHSEKRILPLLGVAEKFSFDCSHHKILTTNVERLNAEREVADSIPGAGPVLRVLK